MKRWLMTMAAASLILAGMRAGALPVMAEDRKPPIRTEGRAHNLPKPSAEAARLFAEARAARASWKAFPGFSADVQVNLDGKTSRGKVQVDAMGKVKFDQLDRAAETWARPILTADVGHRLESESGSTACAFADEDANHPLGRAITLIGDGMGSAYRIRDKQIAVVNRKMGKSCFSITLLESQFNKEGKYLPRSFIVHYRDADRGELQRTDAYSNTWTRVGSFDLPVMTRVVSTSREVSARSITLSNHKLTGKGE